MRVTIAILSILACALAACAEDGAASFGIQPKPGPAIVDAGPQSVIVGPVGNASDTHAKKIAEAHCNQFGLVARLPRMIDSDKVHYICVQ